jgi:hypothetical protein
MGHSTFLRPTFIISMGRSVESRIPAFWGSSQTVPDNYLASAYIALQLAAVK